MSSTVFKESINILGTDLVKDSVEKLPVDALVDEPLVGDVALELRVLDCLRPLHLDRELSCTWDGWHHAVILVNEILLTFQDLMQKVLRAVVFRWEHDLLY